MDVTSRFLKQAYEVFQTKIGLGGNIFTKDFDKYGVCATEGWFKNLWHLCHIYKVDFRIRNHDITLLREGYGTIMDRVVELDMFTKTEVLRLNRVWKFLKVHCLGDITMADGMTLRQEIINAEGGLSKRVFPLEKLTKVDCKL